MGGGCFGLFLREKKSVVKFNGTFFLTWTERNGVFFAVKMFVFHFEAMQNYFFCNIIFFLQKELINIHSIYTGTIAIMFSFQPINI